MSMGVLEPKVIDETGSSLSTVMKAVMEMAVCFAKASRTMLIGSIALAFFVSLAWGCGAYAFRSINSTTFWIIGGIALIPVVVCVAFCVVFYLAMTLPGCIESNKTLIQTILTQNVSNVGAALNQDGRRGAWRVLAKGGKILKTIFDVADEVESTTLAFGCATAMATPWFWGAYGITIVTCVVMCGVVGVSTLLRVVF